MSRWSEIGHHKRKLPGEAEKLPPDSFSRVCVWGSLDGEVCERGAFYFVKKLKWKNNKKTNVLQTSLFPELNADEKVIYDLLLQNSELTLDEFVAKSDLSLPKIASILLNLELKNIIVCLPGKKYKIM